MTVRERYRAVRGTTEVAAATGNARDDFRGFATGCRSWLRTTSGAHDIVHSLNIVFQIFDRTDLDLAFLEKLPEFVARRDAQKRP